jgi:hypothetical protein
LMSIFITLNWTSRCLVPKKRIQSKPSPPSPDHTV